MVVSQRRRSLRAAFRAPFRRPDGYFNLRQYEHEARIARRRLIRRLLPNRIQAAFEGGVQRVRVAIEGAEERLIAPVAAEEEIFDLLLRVFNHLCFGGHYPLQISFVEQPTLEDVSPEVAMCWPDSWFAMECFSRGTNGIVQYAEQNFDASAMLHALGILEWSRDHSERIGNSVALYLWMLLTEEDAEGALADISKCLYTYNNDNLEFTLKEDRTLPYSWMLNYGNN